MLDALEIITKVIEAHHVIRQHVKLAGEAVADIEALFALQKAHSSWSQSSSEALGGKQSELRQSISFLVQGLKNHFGFEEKALPPLFGETLMKALLVEHHGIGRKMDNAEKVIAGTGLGGLGQPELLAKKADIQKTINDLCQAVEEHAGHEEIILNMIKKALENKE